MSEERQEHYHFPTDAGQEVVIRHGSAAPIYDPVPVIITGTITSPSEFFLKRGEKGVPKEKSHLLFEREDKVGPTIKLIIDEMSKFKNVITGRLVKPKFLTELGINSGEGFTIEGLHKVIQFQKVHFYPMEDHKNLKKRLTNFKVKVEATAEAGDDRQGNTKKSVETKVTEFIGKEDPLKFTLRMPIYEGEEDAEIEVTTELAFESGVLKIYLMSDDLDLMEEALIDKVWDREKEIFKDYVIIDQ